MVAMRWMGKLNRETGRAAHLGKEYKLKLSSSVREAHGPSGIQTGAPLNQKVSKAMFMQHRVLHLGLDRVAHGWTYSVHLTSIGLPGSVRGEQSDTWNLLLLVMQQ